MSESQDTGAFGAQRSLGGAWRQQSKELGMRTVTLADGATVDVDDDDVKDDLTALIFAEQLIEDLVNPALAASTFGEYLELLSGPGMPKLVWLRHAALRRLQMNPLGSKFVDHPRLPVKWNFPDPLLKKLDVIGEKFERGSAMLDEILIIEQKVLDEQDGQLRARFEDADLGSWPQLLVLTRLSSGTTSTIPNLAEQVIDHLGELVHVRLYALVNAARRRVTPLAD